jgi:hypothetical protein
MRYARISCGWSKSLKPNVTSRAFIRTALHGIPERDIVKLWPRIPGDHLTKLRYEASDPISFGRNWRASMGIAEPTLETLCGWGRVRKSGGGTFWRPQAANLREQIFHKRHFYCSEILIAMGHFRTHASQQS